MKNYKTYLIVALALAGFILLMQSRSQTTGKSFLGIGATTSSTSPWYEKLGAGAGTFLGNLSNSLWGSKSTSATSPASADSQTVSV